MSVGQRFRGRVALVTGGGSGIGLGIVQRFAEEGAKVALVEVDESRGRQAASDVRSKGLLCDCFTADVSKEEEVIRVMSSVGEALGGIDHLVNNAGIILVKPVEEQTVEEWDRVMSVNVRSIFLTAKHALPWLRRASAPTIVNIGSISSFVAQKGIAGYVASKGAVLMLSKGLALDLASDHIRVNCVCPGITDTPMLRFHLSQDPDPEETLRERVNRVPLDRVLTPGDIARSVLYLSSEESSGITGTSLIVDGGYLTAAEWSNR
jgi:NAD(P)-dependent dehydrogenase (short-subunit alcohol dehydrogenase family)